MLGMQAADNIDILLVEDNPADVFLLKKMLQASSLHVNTLFTTDRVREAQKALKTQHFHVALLDLSLPDSFGIDTYLGIKPEINKIPVIILTGLNDAGIALEALKLGAQDYLVKGEFNSDLLRRAIQYSLERKKVEEELQKNITAAVLKAQERERAHLGAELHDNINQILATSMLFLEHAKSNIDARDELISKSLNVISLAIEEIRKLSRTLIVRDVNVIGLKKAIRELIAGIIAVKKMQISLNMDGFPEKKINEEVKIAIYRIIQEQLTNILKHADASSVIIELKKEGKQIILQIQDNGKGFDITLHRKGVGLTNINSRVSIYDGEVKIDSAPGKGCHLKVVLLTKN